MARKQATLGIDAEVDAMVECKNIVLKSWGTDSLLDCDKEVSTLIDQENNLQHYTLELAVSENFTSEAVCEALVNKYVGGIPGKRYGGGNVFIDKIENLCKSRALELFGLDPAQWSVNVQPYSSSGAIFSLYMSLLEPNNHIMGLDVLSGGNVSHGYCTNSEKVSAASIYFSNLSYKRPQTGYVDYEELEKETMKLKPKLIICGGNAYLRDWDYAIFRSIANKCSALLLFDMGHLSGLVAAKVAQTPFDHCDVVTAPTNMILRGPQSCVISYRKGLKDPRNVNGLCNYEDRINSFVSPSQQGGPHSNLIAAIVVTFKLAMMPNFRNYVEKLVKVNTVALGQHLKEKGYHIVTDGTDSDILLWDLRTLGLTCDDVVHICGLCNISLKKCPLLGDRNPIALGGILIGTAAMTSRVMNEEYFELISEFLHKAVEICIMLEEGVNLKSGSVKKNQDFTKLKATILEFFLFLIEGSDLSDPKTAGTSSFFDSNSAAL